MAKGFSQVAGIDETTSPTPVAAPVKMIAAVANEKGLPVYHLDVSGIRAGPSEGRYLYASSSWLW